MQVTLDWIHLAAVIGAVQGILLAGALVAHRTNRTANRLLAALTLAFTIYLLAAVYYSLGLIARYPQFFGVSYPLPWIFGPLVYLYAVAASDRSRRLEARDALHFLPALIVVCVALPSYMMDGASKVALYARLQAGNPPTTIALLDPTKLLSGIAYSLATVMHLRRHARRIRDTYSNIERVNLRWLLYLAGAAAAIWLLAVGFSLAGLVPETRVARSDDFVSLAIALLAYAVGYMGLRQPEIFRLDTPPASPTPRVVVAAPNIVPISSERAELRYERSGLRGPEASALKASLLELMDRDRPYRDPELTLPMLAERLDTTPHKLSEVLNSEIGQPFYDFVNGYRVEEVRRRLGSPDAQRFNVLTLALDAGFASKSTFNQVFKKQTGHTPSAYKKALAS